MTNANDIEFSELALELIEEWGVVANWVQDAGDGIFDVSERKRVGSTEIDESVDISPMTNDKQRLAAFHNTIAGDAIAYVRPQDLLIAGGSTFAPKTGAIIAFPNSVVVTLISSNRLFSGDDIAAYELLLRA